ncbi:SAM-dependent methyltransferase [Rugosimonospora acidiphila]|uniref:SAM-dependent methyltransferase n=1 Tax=Rugosimonospora acidiphila TaxID=556531 RepID=A0ABP9RNP5_9ACTN
MTRYALLIAPSSNRVYADASVRLTQAELAIFAPRLSTPPDGVGELRLGGVRYVGFDAELTGDDVALLANLSSIYALFAMEGDGLLRPIELRPMERYDDDLITIPKYAGKTNEQFTKLLLNAAVLGSDAGPAMLTRQLTVLDPLCGRGTTLNQALMYGYHGIGIEVDGKDVDAYSAFLRTWLKRKRIKHHAETNPVRRDRKLVARRFEVTIGGDQRLTVFNADTTKARDFLRAGSADVLVADAPYGVAHVPAAGGRSRGVSDLLRSAVPVWTQLLRPGGTIGLAWNTYLAPRPDVAGILADNGLTVLDGPGYDDLEHRVDQAIIRDVLVARK